MSSALGLRVIEPTTFNDPDSWRVEPGASHPLGAHVVDDGVNFAVFADDADSVDVLLFARPEDPYPVRTFPLAESTPFWHAFVRGAGTGTTYAFRARGPNGSPFRFDPRKVLLRAFDTSLAPPLDASEPGEEPLVSGTRYPAGPRSAAVLVSGEE
jgi:pullulanase/glycogen debranching enzyme